MSVLDHFLSIFLINFHKKIHKNEQLLIIPLINNLNITLIMKFISHLIAICGYFSENINEKWSSTSRQRQVFFRGLASVFFLRSVLVGATI